MVRQSDQCGWHVLRLRSSSYRRWVSAAIAVAMAFRMLLPLHDGLMISAGGGLVPVCTAAGLKFLPTPGPDRRPVHRSGDMMTCVHGLAAVSCLHDQARPVCASGAVGLLTPAFDEPNGFSYRLQVPTNRARDPPWRLVTHHQDAEVIFPS